MAHHLECTQSGASKEMNEMSSISIPIHWGTRKNEKLKALGILLIQPIPPRTAFLSHPNPQLLSLLLTLTASHLVNPGPCFLENLKGNAHLILKSPILHKVRKEETVRGLYHFNNKNPTKSTTTKHYHQQKQQRQ